MKKLLFLQRILASLIDLILIYLPCQFLLFILFGTIDNGQFWLSLILFVIYNVLSTMYFSGKTVGKYFARLEVTPVSRSIMEMGQREVAKVLYFLPYVGFLFMAVSAWCFYKNGQFLHDRFGRSEVIISGQG